MAGIKNINDMLSKYGETRLREIISQDVRVTEKFDAFRFSFEKHPKTYKIQYYGKNGKTPLNRVDRTISDLYEEAIDYIENLPYEIRKAIPIRQRFGFSWFPSKSPLMTEYEKRPRHGLILTDITIRNNKFEVINEVQDGQVFERWSSILKVDYAKPIFEGKLKKETIDLLIESCKNPSIGMLKESEVFTPGFLNSSSENVEALVFEFPDELMKVGEDRQTSNENRSHLFDILLLNICEHLESYNLSRLKSVSANPDEGYIEIVSEVFNDYVEEKGKEFLESGLKKPEFLSKSGTLSRKWIKNPKTLAILETDERFEYLFSIFLANLKKPRYKSGLISESVAQSFNQKIEEIDRLSGNDFSFLEFSSIQHKEEKITEKIEQGEILPKEPDYVKAVSLLTRFFDEERFKEAGKTPVNVLITNANAITNDVIDEADRLKTLNGNKSIIIHSENLFKKSYGTEENTTARILTDLVNDHKNLFIGYKVVNRPFYRRIVDSLRPDYEPVIILSEESAQDMQKEKDGYSTLYREENSPTIDVLRSSTREKLKDCLENDNYKSFKDITPNCLHPYWEQLKSAFHKFYYQ